MSTYRTRPLALAVALGFVQAAPAADLGLKLQRTIDRPRSLGPGCDSQQLLRHELVGQWRCAQWIAARQAGRGLLAIRLRGRLSRNAH
jgi:hypothetical protein